MVLSQMLGQGRNLLVYLQAVHTHELARPQDLVIHGLLYLSYLQLHLLKSSTVNGMKEECGYVE